MSNEKVLIFKTDTNKLEYHDMPTGGADGVGAGHITILPYSYNSIGQGTWLWYVTNEYILNGCLYNSSNTNGDEISYKINLSKGIYTLRMLTTTFTNRGIMKIYIDDIEVASFDKYSSIAKYNVTKTKTGINISTTGLKTLKIKCVGQNISSSGYYMHFQSITLWRTE